MKNRRSIRLSGYDYAQEGLYFVTILIKDRQCLLSTIKSADAHLNKIAPQDRCQMSRTDTCKVELSPIGQIVEEEWNNTSRIRENVKLHDFVIMPNHLHGIVEITHKKANPNTNIGFQSPSHALGAIIRGFKIAVIKQLKVQQLGVHYPLLLEWDYKLWHRNYYEHIIRDAAAYQKICEYILDNPRRWVEKQ